MAANKFGIVEHNFDDKTFRWVSVAEVTPRAAWKDSADIVSATPYTFESNYNGKMDSEYARHNEEVNAVNSVFNKQLNCIWKICPFAEGILPGTAWLNCSR